MFLNLLKRLIQPKATSIITITSQNFPSVKQVTSSLVQSSIGSHLDLIRQWFIPCFSQVVAHTLLQSDSGSYLASVRQWFIPCFSQTVVHTLLQSDSGSYLTSVRQWFIHCLVRQWFILYFSQTVVHTLLQSDSGSYIASVRQWFILWFSLTLVQSQLGLVTEWCNHLHLWYFQMEGGKKHLDRQWLERCCYHLISHVQVLN